MGKRYRVTLELKERRELEELLAKGKADVRAIDRLELGCDRHGTIGQGSSNLGARWLTQGALFRAP